VKVKKDFMIFEAYKYKKGQGLEDGFDCNDISFFSVFGAPIECDDPCVKCKSAVPYIITADRARTYVRRGNFVLIDEEGKKYVVKPKELATQYEVIEE